MTSATTTPTRGSREREGYGLIVFAAVPLLVVGGFNLIDGISAVARLWGLCSYGNRENVTA